MSTYTEVKTVLDEIAQRTTQNSKRVAQAKAALTQAQADLAAMPGAYGAIITALDNAATANPDNAAWQASKAEKDQMVADFNSLKAEVDALVIAVG
jgi:hypothetical protein